MSFFGCLVSTKLNDHRVLVKFQLKIDSNIDPGFTFGVGKWDLNLKPKTLSGIWAPEASGKPHLGFKQQHGGINLLKILVRVRALWKQLAA